MGLTSERLNQLMSAALRRWGLPDGFTMHSLRHGRAALAALQKEAPEEIRRAGRWSTMFSMEPYMQMAVVLTFDLQVVRHPLARFAIAHGPVFRYWLVDFALLFNAMQTPSPGDRRASHRGSGVGRK
jgi:hypothetical protein